MRGFWFTLWFACPWAVVGWSQQIPVPQNLWRLERQEDTDGDHRITVHDHLTPFGLQDDARAEVGTVAGAYELSVLLQELKRAQDRHDLELDLAKVRLSEDVIARTHRLINEYYWDALTRRIDAEHLSQVLPDPKTHSKLQYLYVPAQDELACQYFKQCEQAAARQRRFPGLQVRPLPSPGKDAAELVRSLVGEHGLLSLKLETNRDGRVVGGTPYVVPGGRFNELYYWDSYFIVLGLLADGRIDLARGMADNLIYEVEVWGEIFNANRTYYLTRSQPPFLTSIIRAVYEAKAADRHWLETGLKAALAEYSHVWMGPEHLVLVGEHRLNRYYDLGEGPCPEVEPGHYDEKLKPWLAQAAALHPGGFLNPELFLNQYQYCGKYRELSARGLTLDAFFKHDRAMRESGHDTTHRFDERTAEFLPCDLNALLYRYEMDFAELIQTEFGGTAPSLGPEFGRAEYWRRQAAARKAAMWELMWDERQGFFFDYDFANRRRSTYISASSLFPLWAGMLDQKDAHERSCVERMAAFSRRKLEQFAGLAATAKESVEEAAAHDARQWDFPFGWPPHQMLAWQGFRRYGLDSDAERLAYRWLYTIAHNAHDYNGTIPEKFDVVTGSHEVFAEYGNVGTKFDYIAPEGFGWMNASFEVGLKFLSPERLQELRNLVPPPAVE